MTPEPPSSAPSPRRGARGGGASGGSSPRDDIQDAYLRRAISEIGRLNDAIAGCARCRPADALPVMGSGSPQADIMMIKWSAAPAEREEGVAFFGRAGSAILKSMQRLGVDPLSLYGTLVVKCGHQGMDAAARDCPPWVADEIAIVMPKIIVVMGERARAALNALDQPMAEPVGPEVGVVQRWTPTIEVLVVPDIDESLDEESAKRSFWEAFRVLGDWHHSQPPY